MTQALIAFSLLLFYVTDAHGIKTTRQVQNQTISWGPCPPEIDELTPIQLECSTILVPLDYTSDDSAPHTLELIRVPVLNSTSRGSIITNFGGPGQSGLENLPLQAELLLNITGGQHDLVSFNPRGSSGRYLRFSCYEDGEEALRAATASPPHLDSNDASLGTFWAQSAVLSDFCYERLRDVGELVGTAFTARDTMQLVDALGQGSLLHYHGISYGSVLGAVIAAMFPDRIGSMVLDGVLNPHEYFNDYFEIESLSDVDSGFRAFLSECISAGPSRCALARMHSDARSLEEAIYAFIDELRTSPIPLPYSLVRPDAQFLASFISYSDLKSLIFSNLYFPSIFPLMASALEGMLEGNFTGLAALRDNTTTYVIGSEVREGIWCGDKRRRAETLEDILPALEESSAASRITGQGILANIAVSCSRWKFHARGAYEGDFRARTLNPVLLIGNTYDPITPLVSAYNVSSGLEGSVVLHRRGFGHVSRAQSSACVTNLVSEYFLTGSLPETGTECQPDAPIF